MRKSLFAECLWVNERLHHSFTTAAKDTGSLFNTHRKAQDCRFRKVIYVGLLAWILKHFSFGNYLFGVCAYTHTQSGTYAGAQRPEGASDPCNWSYKWFTFA